MKQSYLLMIAFSLLAATSAAAPGGAVDGEAAGKEPAAAEAAPATPSSSDGTNRTDEGDDGAPGSDGAASPDVFVPSEEISEDLSIAFPVDI